MIHPNKPVDSYTSFKMTYSGAWLMLPLGDSHDKEHDGSPIGSRPVSDL